MAFSGRLASLLYALVLPLCASAADAVDAARALHQKGQAGAALAELDVYLKANPKEPRARFLRGVILAEQQKADEAIAVFRALNEDMPELPEPYNNLAVLYAAQGRYEDARRVLETAVLANPGYALAHENLGDLYARMATQAYERASKVDPKAASARAKQKQLEQFLSR